MSKIPQDYIEKVYAGLLGKIIGVRFGAPIEGWNYERIKKTYGEITGYLIDYKDFAADDDSNGPMFFIRALEDFTCTTDITAQQIGLTWLNYTPYEHGMFWWGGYGISTEHTAYLNLRNGIAAPHSGSAEQNGIIIAEQIGGQIFIDTWGLVNPANPERAAKYTLKASSVSHGGNGMYGGMFIAACISAAFVEKDIKKIIEAGLSVIPSSCEYSRMTFKLLEFYEHYPENWRDCFSFVISNFGYERYPGVCPIIPNSAIIILSLLYGRGDFKKTLTICNMCGWDTDCNTGNVGTIMGVRNGLEGIDYEKWRKPINDFLACSSVIGSLNILDIPWCAIYIAGIAYKIAGQEPSSEWKDILERKTRRFHFEFPGSTHGFRVSSDIDGTLEYNICNTIETYHLGKRALKVVAGPLNGGNELRIYYKTYYRPENFHDSRYNPSFSPILYPGQRIKGYVLIPKDAGFGINACLYIKDGNSNRYIKSESVSLILGEWNEISYNIPFIDGACLEEAGVMIIPRDGKQSTLEVFIDDFEFYGSPDYTIDFRKERMEVWNNLHKEVSQFTYLKGIWELEDGELSGSCCDFGEAYTGGYNWMDYIFEATIIPRVGGYHNINFRVQGAIRSYAVGLAPDDKLVLYKNDNGYEILSEIEFHWENGGEYSLKVEVSGLEIKVMYGNSILLEYIDTNHPYLFGQIGVSVQSGSHCHYKNFKIKGIGKTVL